MGPSFISISEFAKSPYSEILGYPKHTPRQIRSRVAELEKLGIRSISLTGPTTIGKLSILGKGYVGVVVLAKMGRRQVALKIRRTDSQRNGMTQEARFLKLANSADVGPRMLGASRNFLVMEYLEGTRVREWIGKVARGGGGAGSSGGPGPTAARAALKDVIRRVLDDCYRLDAAGLDHGELNNVSKHVIVGGSRVSLIDFESSSTKRRPANVTSITQAIFIGSGIAKDVQKAYRTPPKEEIIRALRTYKQQKTRDSFDGLLRVLKL